MRYTRDAVSRRAIVCDSVYEIWFRLLARGRMIGAYPTRNLISSDSNSWASNGTQERVTSIVGRCRRSSTAVTRAGRPFCFSHLGCFASHNWRFFLRLLPVRALERSSVLRAHFTKARSSVFVSSATIVACPARCVLRTCQVTRDNLRAPCNPSLLLLRNVRLVGDTHALCGPDAVITT